MRILLIDIHALLNKQQLDHYIEQGRMGTEFLAGAGSFLGGCGIALREGVKLLMGVVEDVLALALLL